MAEIALQVLASGTSLPFSQAARSSLSGITAISGRFRWTHETCRDGCINETSNRTRSYGVRGTSVPRSPSFSSTNP